VPVVNFFPILDGVGASSLWSAMQATRGKGLLLLACALLLPGAALSAQVSMEFEYPGVEVFPGEGVSLGLVLQNRGTEDVTIDLAVVAQAAGWVSSIKSGALTVTGAYVPAGTSKTLTFVAAPSAEEKPGRYLFRVEGRGVDRTPALQKIFAVTVRERREQSRGSAGIGLAASYPILRGASDIFYEFSVEMVNKMDTDEVFDLSSQGPQGWEVNIKPAYEARYISNLQLKAKENRKLTVEVKPPAGAPPGDYAVTVRASSGAAYAAAALTVVLTGTYELSVTTASGVLSLEAQQGKPARVSIFIKNLGTAAQGHVGLLSFKPENWNLDFVPDRIDGLAPGDTKQVEVLITPHDKALVGDYSVEVKAIGEKASKSIEFRVTVKASSIFGWIGIALIVLVVLGLALIFRWLGRR
jgi:uncharacterized membrane protein